MAQHVSEQCLDTLNALLLQVDYLISTKIDVRSGGNTKIEKAQSLGKPIVAETFVTAAVSEGKRQVNVHHRLSPPVCGV